MKTRVTILVALLVLLVGGLVLFGVGNDGSLAAQAVPFSNDVPPEGGGEFEFAPMDEMSDEEGRSRIQSEIRENLLMLERQGRLEPARPEAVPLAWPVAKAAGVNDFFVDAISNYVDQNPAFPNQVRDWNCGSRTYDTTSGYNHKGIDVFTWPFSWKKVDDNAVEVVAGAPGTIALKSDGQPDRSCSLNGTQWNAVYIRHSDNSVAWYGHMKNGSLINKAVGQTVVAGEKLGIVASSGNSTGPHLHFELYNANNQLQDPFQGSCNTINSASWWATQEPYRVSRLNALMTHSAPPNFNTCPAAETINEKTTFQAGETVYTIAYYRDQVPGPATQYALIRPDGSSFLTWTGSNTQTFSASYWFWSWPLPTNAPAGTWKLRALYNGVTSETPFTVTPGISSASVTGRVTTPGGQALRNATVSLIAGSVRRTATTSSFGVYTFNDVATGSTYTLNVSSKRYRFTARTLPVNGNLTGIDFIGLE